MPHRSGVPGTSPLRYANGDAPVVATRDFDYQFVRPGGVQAMCHVRSSTGGTTTWTEQAIHPEAARLAAVRRLGNASYKGTGTPVRLAARGKHK